MESPKHQSVREFHDLSLEQRKVVVAEARDRMRELSRNMRSIGRNDIVELLDKICEGLHVASFLSDPDGAGLLQRALTMMDAVESEIAAVAAAAGKCTTRH
ncbi:MULTISPECIES: hypothetical protein [unclassified Rhizobium]|uniref:hypothetical protein n=1 Tax=unclassified Rhizobium TaxID=2613769 RepID=UPI00161836F8|nr:MULTISPECIES: hypothetical protein [unclassified Rhizobium]MBB3318244.1 hypothetical protein [Rhizobium sp. BK181]MBB3543821.1 hypothetical protein [Rhizobium sp. BK399]MCS4094048.1 hypothetical protein [Rhizobium sp. BK176]